MKDETKNQVKKNVATGASTAAGAAAGVVIGASVTPESAAAAEVIATEPAPQTAHHSHSTHTSHPSHPSPAPQPQPQPEPVPDPQPDPQPDPEPEVEVVGYDRVTHEDGSQTDIAVVSVNGNEIGILDTNLDGYADVMVCDVNQNEVIEEGEVQNVQGQGIEMQGFADAAGFSPEFAQNNLPDYVNDADVDTYMA